MQEMINSQAKDIARGLDALCTACQVFGTFAPRVDAKLARLRKFGMAIDSEERFALSFTRLREGLLQAVSNVPPEMWHAWFGAASNTVGNREISAKAGNALRAVA